MKQVDYSEISKIYDDVREGDIQLINQFLEELPPDCALNVLDIGCGTGNYTNLFQKITQERGYKFRGIDPSEAMLSKARQKNNVIKFQVGAAEQIPVQANVIDFVYMTDVIHHVSDISKMFAEIHRVLKLGGKVCIVTQSRKQIEQRPIAQFFPRTVQIDQCRYPGLKRIIKSAEHNCLSYLKKKILTQRREIELGAEFLELVRKKGFSMLHLLSEHEYQIGLLALKGALGNGPITAKSAGETFIWFRKDQLSA